ncbi:MAG TPA: xanthine dehydrogenase family protein molybdopterin-binding subunit [Steroidobacteraceae bacterium]|jgi:xanthine dehydrogenase YagR molybdenum-binding subunit|nr:xanthine dehydrogenase family protein molybdopterin-binding subunit [Steroidobacteraceae bacterium]
MEWVGAAVDRVDGRSKITGTATYSGDVNLAHMAHAVLVLSTIASGRITTIDSSEATRMPGVLAVITHLNSWKLPDQGRAGVNPPAGRVLTLLQDEAVYFDRQPVAVVVADSLDQAKAAAAHVKIGYAAQAPTLLFSQAKAGAHAPEKVNQESADSERGQIPADSFAGIQAVYTTPMQHHNPMEPHATVAQWQGDQLILYDTTQYVSGCRTTIAKTLGIPRDNVRVISPYVGGGFGCKGSTWAHVPLAAMAARQVARPVKLVLERPQMFGPVGGRPQTEQHLLIQADDGHRLTGTRHEVFSHTSMIEDFTEPSALQTRMLYGCDNVQTSHRLVRLSVGTPTFQRAPGEATGTFALESALDELAYRLNLDPLELRRRNEPPMDQDKRLPWSSRKLLECYSQGARAFGWSSRNPTPRSMTTGKLRVGLGMATATYPANRSPAAASAALTEDGLLIVKSGTQDLGTGTYTIMTQVAAQTMGFPLAQVRFELGDSRFPEAPVSGGSQSAASVTPAVQSAVAQLRRKLMELAAADQGSPVFGAPLEDIVIEEGAMGRRGEQRREPVAALLARTRTSHLEAEAATKPGAEKQRHSFHSFGAVFAEVHVDPELGVVRVARIVARYDVGRLLNAKTGRSQLLGGIVMGVGLALMEESVLDQRHGRIVNANLAEYHVPTHADIGIIDVDVIDDSDPYIDPLGARGIGEIGITGVGGAIGNAVHHATGVRVRDLPITLDKLLT